MFSRRLVPRDAVQSALLRLHVVRPSVRPSVCLSVRLSVTLVDQDHICWKSWKLIARTISPTPSLFVPNKPSAYTRGTWGNFGETRGEVGKVVCWITKAAISMEGHTNALSNGTIPDPLCPLFPTIGAWRFATSTQNSNRYYLRNG